KAVAERRQELRPTVTKELREKRTGETRDRISSLEARLSMSDQLAKRLEEDVRTFSKMSQQMNRNQLDLEDLKAEIAPATEIAKKAAAAAEAMEVERKQPPRVKRLDAEPKVRKQ